MTLKPPAIRIAAFTLLELLAVVAIIAVLATLLVPFVSRMLDRATETKCAGRLRNLGAAVHLFAADNNNRLVTAGLSNPFVANGGYGRAFFLLGPYIAPKIANNLDALRRSPVFRCPTFDSVAPELAQASQYKFSLILTMRNAAGTSWDNNLPTPLALAAVVRPDRTPLAWDTAEPNATIPYRPHPDAIKFGYQGPTDPGGMAPLHGPRCNVLFVSGRVAPVDVSSINNFPWNGTAPAKWPLNTVFDPFYNGN